MNVQRSTFKSFERRLKETVISILLVLRDNLRLLVVGWLHLKRFLSSSQNPRPVDDDGQGVATALPHL